MRNIHPEGPIGAREYFPIRLPTLYVMYTYHPWIIYKCIRFLIVLNVLCVVTNTSQ